MIGGPPRRGRSCKSQVLVVVVAAALLASASTLPARADQNAPELPALFEALAAAENERAARLLEQRIWSLWMHSPHAEIEGLLERGGALMASGRLDEAVSVFSEIVVLEPGFAEGWNKRATAHYLRRDYAASMLDIRRTLDLEPRHFGAISGMGLILMEIGDLRGALSAFEHVLTLNPNSNSARHHRDLLRRRIGASGA